MIYDSAVAAWLPLGRTFLRSVFLLKHPHLHCILVFGIFYLLYILLTIFSEAEAAGTTTTASASEESRSSSSDNNNTASDNTATSSVGFVTPFL